MFIVFRILTDIIFIPPSFVFAYLIKFNSLNFQSLIGFPIGTYSSQLLIILLVYLAVFYFVGLYKSRRGFLIEIDEAIGVFSGVTIAWAVLIILTFIRGEYEFSRPLILLSWPITFAILLVSRVIIIRVEMFARKRGFGSRRAAVIGEGELAQELAKRIKEHPSYGILFVRFIPGDDLTQIERVVKSERIKVVFVADRSISREKLVELASLCDEFGVKLGSIPDVFEILTTSPAVEDIDGLPMVSLKPVRFTPLNRFLKRTFDIFFSLFGIIIFSPVMLLIAPLIRLTSPGGPAIYAQERVGRGGKIFKLYKFRTMIPDAERVTGPVLSSEDDPRKTPFGRFLRRANLDELPQLFNILKGDMSFVGPRPERPEFVEEFKELIPKYMERHKIRPGLAGWAQLHGGYNMPAEEKIKYDLYYIENRSFLLDIKIILKYLQISFTLQREN